MVARPELSELGVESEEFMTALEMICGRKPRLGIVWRNPNTVRPHRRRHTLEAGRQGALYILQEFVENDYLSYWTTLSDLEVVLGGRAA